jgi:hypothetical protein
MANRFAPILVSNEKNLEGVDVEKIRTKCTSGMFGTRSLP